MYPIQKKSLGEQAEKRIKDQIISLEIKPGTRLLVDDLALKLGVSRTPIRDGLKKLATQGLVTYNNNGYMVIKYSKKDIEDIYDIRISLEVLSTKFASTNMSEKIISMLDNLLSEVKEKLEKESPNYFIPKDLEFHRYISKGSGNTRLMLILDNLREQILYIRCCLIETGLKRSAEKETLEEHMKVLMYLKNKDTKKAMEMMEEHLERGKERTLRWLENKNIGLKQ